MSLDCPHGHKRLTWRSSSVKRGRYFVYALLRSFMPDVCDSSPYLGLLVYCVIMSLTNAQCDKTAG